jgi:dTDP-4-amino-4,6-dideoxygalactose transaminase
MARSLFSKLRNWRRYFYPVPWCVPQWGREEFVVTCLAILTGRVVAGPSPAKLASAVEDYLGVRFSRPVNRGRTAIEVALRALQLQAGDEVILPSYVCESVLDAVLAAGVDPVFADLGPDLNVTADTIKAALTANTRCVIVAHLFGKAAPIDEIEVMLSDTGIAIIDDAAQSFGARRAGRLVGTFGACGIVSCGPGKSLAGAAGGLFVTNDAALYQRAAAIPLDRERASQIAKRTLAFWIWRRFRGLTLPLGLLLDRFAPPPSEASADHVNAPLSNLDAAIMLAQFRSLDKNRNARLAHATLLLSALGDAARLAIANLSEADMALKLVLVLPDGLPASRGVDLLSEAGIECQVGYQPLHLKGKAASAAALELTDALWERVLCMPVERALKNTMPLARVSPGLIVSRQEQLERENRLTDPANDVRNRAGRTEDLVESKLANNR